MRTLKFSLLACALLFWMTTLGALGQANFWHQSLWWDGFVVTSSGIGTMTNTFRDVITTGNFFDITNTSGIGGIAISSAGSSDVYAFNTGGTLQLGGLVTGATVDTSGNLVAASFSGPGAGITALNASALASGTVPLAVLAAAVITNNNAAAVTLTNVANSFTGSFTGNGAGITNLSPTQSTNVGVYALPFDMQTNGAFPAKSNKQIGISPAGNFFVGDSLGNWTNSAQNVNGISIVGGMTEVGSSSNMGSSIQNTIIEAAGSPTGWTAPGDHQTVFRGWSVNPIDSGSGSGPAIMGGADTAGKATTVSINNGPFNLHSPATRASFLLPGMGYTVWNQDAVNDNGYCWCSPNFPNGALDTGNYPGWVMDTKNGLVGSPLLNSSQLGLYQPSDVVYDFLATNVATVPVAVAIYYNNGHEYTFYSNSVFAGGVGHLTMTSKDGAPLASGTLTKTNFTGTGAGDASIVFLTSASLRAYNWGVKIDPKTGNISEAGINTATNGFITTAGNFQSQTVNSSANNVNRFATASNITYFAANQSGFLVQDNGSAESACIGTRSSYIFSGNSGNTGDLWYASPTGDIGGNEMANVLSTGNNTWTVHGRFSTYPTNYAGNKTLGVLDSTVIVKANGVAVITLPDATSHAIGAQYQLLNDGTTNVTVLTTSAQTIGNNSTQTSNTIVPGQAFQVQGDTANWKYTYSPGVIKTNLVSGALNTNTYGRLIEVSGNVTITETGVVGNAVVALLASGYKTNYFGESTLITSLAVSKTNFIAMTIPPGQTYTVTNLSTGVGDSGGPLDFQITVF